MVGSIGDRKDQFDRLRYGLPVPNTKRPRGQINLDKDGKYRVAKDFKELGTEKKTKNWQGIETDGK